VTAKERILSRIRTAAVPRADYVRTETPVLSASLDLFCERVADYRAIVHRVSQDEVSATLNRICEGRRCLVAADFEFVIEGAIADAGFTHAELVDFETTITSCAVGIAESGTIVLDARQGQGRRAITLIPDHHVCIIRADQVVSSLEEGLERVMVTRPLTFISGPSATSDIELVRVEGVHGPRKLEVLVVEA